MEARLKANRVYISGYEVINNGTVVYDDTRGEILEVLPDSGKEHPNTKFYNGVITAGFVNAHCHLEFSHLKGKIKAHQGLAYFIKHILEARKEDRQNTVIAAAKTADEEMQKNGIVSAADLSNSDNSFPIKIDSPIDYHNFYELTGYDLHDAELSKAKVASTFLILNGMTVNISPHSIYANSPQAIKNLAERIGDGNGMLSLHFMESAEEKELFEHKTGKLAKLLSSLGLNLDTLNPTGLSQAEYLGKHLPADIKTILVHNTFATETDIQYLSATKNIWWALCPNSNLYIEDQLPDINLFTGQSGRVLLGTDSLASNTGLSILEEMKTITRHFPQVSFGQMLNWATVNGARILNRQKKIGRIERGKAPGLNLIENFDFKNDKLTGESSVKVLA